MPDDHSDKPDAIWLSQRAHRTVVGILGLLLSPLAYVVAGVRNTEGLAPWELLDSVSAYYYTGAMSVFVGVLFSMALFLGTYRGYEGFPWDRVVGRTAGATGLGVAFFPTTAPQGAPIPSWWREWHSVVHYTCAVTLFVCFFLFAVWLFRRSDVPPGRPRPKDKRIRDLACLICGIVIAIMLPWAAANRLVGLSMFIPESVAIAAFSVSWLVKAEVHKAAAQVLGVSTGGAKDPSPTRAVKRSGA